MTFTIAATDSAAVGAGVLPWSWRRNAVSAAPGATRPTTMPSSRKSVCSACIAMFNAALLAR